MSEEASAAEQQSNEQSSLPAKPKRKFRWIMAAVTLLFVCCAAAAAVIVHNLRVREQQCEQTVLPEGLSAVDTVKQYFEYWNDGNNNGMNQAALPDENRDPVSKADSFNAGLCYFCDIELERAEQLDIMAEGFEGCYESAVVSVDFSYKTKFGFGDSTIPEENKGWEFYLAKVNEGDSFRIISVEKS